MPLLAVPPTPHIEPPCTTMHPHSACIAPAPHTPDRTSHPGPARIATRYRQPRTAPFLGPTTTTRQSHATYHVIPQRPDLIHPPRRSSLPCAAAAVCVVVLAPRALARVTKLHGAPSPPRPASSTASPTSSSAIVAPALRPASSPPREPRSPSAATRRLELPPAATPDATDLLCLHRQGPASTTSLLPHEDPRRCAAAPGPIVLSPARAVPGRPVGGRPIGSPPGLVPARRTSPSRHRNTLPPPSFAAAPRPVQSTAGAGPRVPPRALASVLQCPRPPSSSSPFASACRHHGESVASCLDVLTLLLREDG